MSISSFIEISDMHKSMLQEIFNMGSGNAATSMATFLSAPTDIGVPQVKVNPRILAGKVADMLGKSAMVYDIKLKEDILGLLLFAYPFPFVERVARNFFPDASISSADDIDEITSSVISETVNLSAAAYATAFSEMTKLVVDISTPELLSVPSEKVLSEIDGDAVCVVNNSIEILDCHRSYSVIFYPELGSINKIMNIFGM